MINTEIIRNGITSLPQDVQDEILKLVEKEDVEQGNFIKKPAIMRVSDMPLQIAATKESFDPKVVFAEGDYRSKGAVFRHTDDFRRFMFNPAKIVSNVSTQNFKSYENKELAFDKQIRAEVGEGVITPDQLWVTWKDLIFRQPRGETGRLRAMTIRGSNCWYVKCYDGIIRSIGCTWGYDPFVSWELWCTDLDDHLWPYHIQFFISDDILKS